MFIPERFDTLLLVSTAIANVIGGLSRLGVGLLQLTGVLVVALLALLALVLLLGGMVRMARCLASPPPSQPWSRCNQKPASCQDDQRKMSRISH
jgi:hypothetical protein